MVLRRTVKECRIGSSRLGNAVHKPLIGRIRPSENGGSGISNRRKHANRVTGGDGQHLGRERGTDLHDDRLGAGRIVRNALRI